MIVSRRFFTWSDVVIRRWLLRDPTFLVKVVETRGVCSDDRLWERAKLWSVVPHWPCVGVPIQGHGMMLSEGAALEMRRGYIGTIDRGETFRARTEPEAAFGVFLQWDPAVYGKPGTSSLMREAIDPRDLSRIGQALRGIIHPQATHDTLLGNVGELFKIFGSLGIMDGERSPREVVIPPPPRVERIGRAIDGVLSRAGTRPMVVDLTRALDCSERQARYLVSEYVGAYALQGVTEWRTLVNVWTTYLAGLLMTAPGATTERVAALLGYGSPNAFCHALTNAGLPSPGEMRRIVADLADGGGVPHISGEYPAPRSTVRPLQPDALRPRLANSG
jgi:hypothetical protein